MMKAWHFLKHLNCTPAAASLSLHLLRSSSFSLSRYSPSLFFLSVHTTASDHWPARGQVKNGHANFSTASSSLAVHSMASPVPVPANYVSVLVRCHKDNSDMLAEALLSFGASSVTMNEDDVCSDTDEICVSSIFLEGEDINMSISHAADSIGLKEIPRYEVKIIEEDDWMKGAQESFHPVEVTEGLWVVPKWITPPDIQAMNIILNPGLAFGTGDHPTTKLCLLLLHDCIKGGEHILDYGTGTGILAIAALKAIAYNPLSNSMPDALPFVIVIVQNIKISIVKILFLNAFVLLTADLKPPFDDSVSIFEPTFVESLVSLTLEATTIVKQPM
ncbi:hypothetical protein AHAS_Ahas03G0171700 [Arachis hypogaea]